MDRKTIIALVLVGIVLLFIPKYYELVNSPLPKPKVQTDTTSVKKTEESAQKPVAEETKSSPSQTLADSVKLVQDSVKIESEYLEIETPLFYMTVASNGQISAYTLRDYKLNTGLPVNLHQSATGTLPIVGAVDFDFGNANLNTLKNTNFTAAKRKIKLSAGSDSLTLVTGGENLQSIALTYVFHAEKYGFDLSLKTNGLREPDTGEYEIKWLGGVPTTEPHPATDLEFAGAYTKMGEALEEITVKSEENADFSATGSTDFVAARSKYFIAAIVPQSPAAGVKLKGKNFNPKSATHDSPHFYDLTLREPWKANASGRWTIYWGPIKLQNLKAPGVGLEETMNRGWNIIKPLSKGVLWTLVHMKSIFVNYGIVIILFSLLVKVVLWPLTRKSQVSMKKMAALQPEIKELRETHAKNPTAMNQAIMALYKERGVNPAGGCLPMLLQMPVLYALFVVFRSTIEFRQAPFMGWIQDLSQPDVIFHLGFSLPLYGSGVGLLPILMGITQFFMSKATATDPNQKAMIYIMPVFMTLLFNNFPSGLTLYYTLFNVWAMVEQKFIKLPDFSTGAVVVDDKRPKKKNGKK